MLKERIFPSHFWREGRRKKTGKVRCLLFFFWRGEEGEKVAIQDVSEKQTDMSFNLLKSIRHISIRMSISSTTSILS